MIVMCEGCETSFQVEDRLIKPTGSKVRCSKCRHVFIAYSPAAVAVPEEPLILSDELPPAPPAGVREELPDIGAQIDALFANDFDPVENTSVDQEPELLDVDDLLVEDAPPVDALTADSSGDDLNLDLDLDLTFDEDVPVRSPSAEPAAAISSSDATPIDFNLDSASSQEALPEDALVSLDELGINLDRLEQMDEGSMPEADKTADSAGAETPELILDLDLDELAAETTEALAPDSTAAGPADALPNEEVGSSIEPAVSDAFEAAQPTSESELDLSDLEAMLEGDSQAMEAKSGTNAEIELDLDMGVAAADGSEKTGDLDDLDLTSIAGETLLATDSVGTTDGLPTEIELSLDLDKDPGTAPATDASVEPQDDEIDFSDITSILEETPTESDAAAGGEAPELDLFLDDGQAYAAPSTPEPQADAQDGLLMNIESLLQDEEASEAPTEQKSAQATEDLDLDLAVGPAPVMAGDLEIEIEPVADGIESNTPVEPAAAPDDLGEKPIAAEDQFSAEGLADTDSGGATRVLEMESAAAAALAAEAPRKSGVRKYLMTAVGVLVVAIAAIVVPRSLDIPIPFLSDLEIPFLGKIFQVQSEDIVGNLKMAPLAENLTAEFIENPGAGRLCVVKGQIRNNYDHPRSAIRVTAKLYTKDKTLAKTATVFAGNVFSNQELAVQDIASITTRLKNKEGANNMNVGVKPGRSIPFMAVFDNLPDNLDEYSVEVAGSTK